MNKKYTKAKINKPGTKMNNIIGKIIAEESDAYALHITGYSNCKQIGYSDNTIEKTKMAQKGITVWLNKSEIEILDNKKALNFSDPNIDLQFLKAFQQLSQEQKLEVLSKFSKDNKLELLNLMNEKIKNNMEISESTEELILNH